MRPPRHAEALAERRRALQQRSALLRERVAGEARQVEASLAHGLRLSTVVVGAAGLGTALKGLRGRAGWRRTAALLRLLPLAWGLWRTMKAARR